MEKVIVTVGPSLFKKGTLANLHSEAYIYRINGAHGTIEDIEKNIQLIRKEIPNASVMIDLPGNKVRTHNLSEPINVKIGEKFILNNNEVNYSNFFKHLNENDIIWANDSTLKFEVIEIGDEKLELISHSNGELQNNKGLHVRGIHAKIPFLFEKDKKLIELSKMHGIEFISLSFVRNIDDIKNAKQIIGKGIKIIPKVETLAATENLDSILQEVDVINVDRGDLSTEVGIDKIYSYQKFIIERANIYHKKVFLATQFFVHMMDKPIPSIAEINDFQSCVKLGIYGIQLSEETAVGKYPEEVLKVVNRVVTNVKSEKLRFVG